MPYRFQLNHEVQKIKFCDGYRLLSNKTHFICKIMFKDLPNYNITKWSGVSSLESQTRDFKIKSHWEPFSRGTLDLCSEA